jgi:uncharacterized protein (TIGR02270 family)
MAVMHKVPSSDLATTAPEDLEDTILVEILEEHWSEAEYLLERFDQVLDQPLLTIGALGRGIEERLLAHVDGLVVAGEPGLRHLLVPGLAEINSLSPFRVGAGIMALVSGGHLAAVWQTLRRANGPTRDVALRACALPADRTIDDWTLESLRSRSGPLAPAALLHLAAQRGLQVAGLAGPLGSADVDELLPALEIAASGCARQHIVRIESLLCHQDPAVRRAATLAALTGGSRRAWQLCEHVALAESAPHPWAMELVAAFGKPPQHDALLGRLSSDPHRRAALWALGYSGFLGAVEPLLEIIAAQKDEAKLAADTLGTLCGIKAASFELKQAPDAQPGPDSLPPLEDDDLDADLVPPAEDYLPEPDPAAYAKWWKESKSTWRKGTRFLGGKPWGMHSLLDAFDAFALWRRHALARILSVGTEGRSQIDTRALSSRQREQHLRVPREATLRLA